MPSLLDRIKNLFGDPKIGKGPREELKVTFEVPAGVGQVVTFGERPLRRGADGKTWSGQVGNGVYVLRWIADTGIPGSEYTIEITAPDSVKWKPNPKLKSASDGRINSFMTVRIGPKGGGGATPGSASPLIGVSILLLLSAMPVSAASQQIDLVEHHGAAIANVAPPGASPGLIGDAAAIFLTAGTADKKVTVEGNVHSWAVGTDGMHAGQLTLSAIAPLSENSPTTTLGDLRGPANGTRVSGTLASFTRSSQTPGAVQIAWCLRLRADGKLPKDFACGAEGEGPFDNQVLDALVKAGKVEREVLETYRRGGGQLQSLWSLTAEVGRSEFNYFQLGTLQHDTTVAIPWSIGGSMGFLTRRLGGVTLFSGGLRYEHSSKPGSNTQLCLPLGTGGALQCRTQPIGAPTRKEAFIADVQARRFFGARFAVNPTVSLRLNDGVLGLQMPVYFAGSTDGGLIAGATPSWNSEDDKFQLSVFVGKAFKFGL